MGERESEDCQQVASRKLVELGINLILNPQNDCQAFKMTAIVKVLLHKASFNLPVISCNSSSNLVTTTTWSMVTIMTIDF